MTCPKAQDMDDRLLREAAAWFVRIHGEDATAGEFGAWQQWLAQDLAHQRAFQSVEDFWQVAGEVAHPPWPAAGELNTDAYDASQPVAQWRGEQQLQVRRFLPAPRLLAAAAVLLVAVGVTLFFVQPRLDSSRLADSASAMTAAAQLREFTLTDGSRMALGAQSRATVNFSAAERRLIVDSGEAFIEVAKDAKRPFIVHAGTGTITALGTAFNIRNVAGRVVVTVVEGKVEVADAGEASKAAQAVTQLVAGQEIIYGSEPAPARPVDTTLAMAWRNGHLKYLHEPLKFVIADVARYSGRHLVIVDPQVGDLLYTGTVLPGQIDDWLTSVGDSLPVRIVRLNPGTVLLKAASGQE